jgi:uncharacterized protein (UPF0147 family)
MNVKDLAESDSIDWPDDAKELIQKTLGNDRAPLDERLVAAELASDISVIDDGVVLQLLALVKRSDVPEELRAKAATALGPILEQGDVMGFDDPDDTPVSEQTFERLRETLRTLYAEASFPKLVRRRILEAAVRSPQSWQQAATRAAYQSADRDWKLTGVFAMGHVAGFEPQILEALSSPDPELRLEAVIAAGKREMKGATPHILKLLQASDTPRNMRLAAIEAAAGMPWPEVADVLTELQDSQDEEVAGAALEAATMSQGLHELGDVGEPEDDEDE